jgi:hypothetical protein
MSDNPFKLIRSTDQPPEALRKEVMTSVKFAMLLMRFVQLFVADFSVAIFDKVRKAGDDTPTTRPNPNSPHGS